MEILSRSVASLRTLPVCKIAAVNKFNKCSCVFSTKWPKGPDDFRSNLFSRSYTSGNASSHLSKHIKNQDITQEDLSEIIRRERQSMVIHERRKSVEFVCPSDIERIVENFVSDAMRKGDLDNLDGMGKPMNLRDEHPFIETGLAKLNTILKSEGYVPNWILLRKEVREGIPKARSTLAIERARLGEVSDSPKTQEKWNFHTERFKKSLSDLNDKIEIHNMEVPNIKLQLVPIRIDNEVQKVFNDHKRYLPEDYKDYEGISESSQQNRYFIDWGEIWRDFKNTFFGTNK